MAIGDWELASHVVEWIEILAIAFIVMAVISASVGAGRALADGRRQFASVIFREHFARWLLLGLDLLIAADVIRTVTLEPTLANVGALGLLVVVRTFLAWTLVLEIEGRWPWQQGRPDSPQT